VGSAPAAEVCSPHPKPSCPIFCLYQSVLLVKQQGSDILFDLALSNFSMIA
jgi:hypothetical protein